MRTLKVLLLLTLLAALALGLDAQRLMQQPLNLTQNQRFDLELGHGVGHVLNTLAARDVFPAARLPDYIHLYARISGKAGQLKAGEYELTPGMNSFDLLALMISGKVLLHELRLTEGWTFAEARAAIAANDALVQTLKDRDDAEVMAALGQPGLAPEGRFFPDTYRFPKGTSDVAFLRRALNAMQQALEQEWAQRAPDLPYRTPEDALVMASIVEKETGVAGERAEVAGVFVRRLKLGMKLQTDPTVIYGLGDAYGGRLRKRDLEGDTPFNTYTRAGLPPTPICLPGRAALRAALHPAAGDALYFVARGDGSHQFSATLEQHNAAVQKFQLGKKR